MCQWQRSPELPIDSCCATSLGALQGSRNQCLCLTVCQAALVRTFAGCGIDFAVLAISACDPGDTCGFPLDLAESECWAGYIGNLI